MVKGSSVRKVTHGKAHSRLRHELQDRPDEAQEARDENHLRNNKGLVPKEW
jgi:hypothetical protein